VKGVQVFEPGVEDRVALVTGAAGKGIGRAIAEQLLDAGARVVVTDSHEARTTRMTGELGERYGDRVIGMTLDVLDCDAIDRTVAAIADRCGPIQILVNNAAINILGDVRDISVEDWNRVMAVNLTAPWYLSRTVFPGMALSGGGAIVNVSSIAGDIGADTEPPYAVSKGGLNVLSRVLARAGGKDGIRCNSVSMTLVEDTYFAASDPAMLPAVLADTPLRRLVRTRDIADVVVFLVSDRGRNITGEIVNVSAGHYMRS
jgi:NAD(P)-dependent dehydrogenase (short-subunit alcohol dehydrogenase family)